MRLLKAFGAALLFTVVFIVGVLILGIALAGLQYLFGETWGSVVLVVSSIFLSVFAGHLSVN